MNAMIMNPRNGSKIWKQTNCWGMTPKLIYVTFVSVTQIVIRAIKL
jgi:hypothetical protein